MARRAWLMSISALGLVLGAILAACLVISLFGVALPAFKAGPPPLTQALSHTIEENGIDAAVVQYQLLKGESFRGFSESENATNDLGYLLLGKHQAAAAVAIFKLNAQTHPQSANAFDSLGEAQVAAGDVPGAIQSYLEALRTDPNFKSSALAYAKLTGIPRKPYLPLVLLHITAGLSSIVFGFAALAVPKGGRMHRWTGTGFFMTMVLMVVDADYLALTRHEPTNILGASFTLYLLLTSWLAAKRRDMKVDAFNFMGLVAAWIIFVAGMGFGLEALSEQSSPDVFIGFSLAALIAMLTDLRVIFAGGITGAQRIARHLWRMCTAMFIAVASFFLGQSQLVPQAMRDYKLQVVPPILVVIALFYWLGKNYLQRYRARRRQSASIGVGALT